jgi:HAD superfamily hydrolase (TIGR01509 family)
MDPVVVFDLSEVLICGLVGVEVSFAPVLGLTPADTLALFAGDHLQRYCRGEIGEDDYLAQVVRQAPSLSVNDLKAAIRRNFHVALPGIRELAAELAARYRVVLLSDHGREWVEYILAIHPWLGTWPERFFSFERGVTKRERKAFTSLAEALGVETARCLLIDDSEGNVQVARQAGWRAIRFEGEQQLAGELQRQGLL